MFPHGPCEGPNTRFDWPMKKKIRPRHLQPIHLPPIHLSLDAMTESLSTDDFDPSILTSDFTSTPDESDRKKRRLNEEL